MLEPVLELKEETTAIQCASGEKVSNNNGKLIKIKKRVKDL